MWSGAERCAGMGVVCRVVCGEWQCCVGLMCPCEGCDWAVGAGCRDWAGGAALSASGTTRWRRVTGTTIVYKLQVCRHRVC